MTKKPTYEELEQRVKALENESLKRKRLDERVRLLSLAIEQSSEGIAVVDLNGNIEYLNDAFAKMHGYSPEELVGKHLSTFHTPDQMPSVETANREIEETGHYKGEIWHVRRDGTVFPALMHNSLIRDEAGHPTGMIGTLRDITDLKAREEEIRASEFRYRELFNNMSSGVAIYEAKDNGNDFIFEGFNRAGERIENIRKGDLIGKSVLEVFPGVKEFGLFDVFKRVWESGKPEAHHISLYKDQRIAGWRDNYVYKLPSGEIVAVYDDVTEQKQAEEALRKSEEQKKAILDASIDGIRLVDKDMRILWANKTTTRELNRTPEELEGEFCYEVLLGRDTPCPGCPTKKALKTGKIEQAFIHQTKSKGVTGETYWDSYAIPLKNASGDIENFIQTTRDITEAKRAEDALRESEKKYRTLLETTSEGYTLLNPERRIVEVNEAFCRMLGYSQDEILGKTPFDFVDDENRGIFIEQTSKISATSHRSYEITLKKKNGEDLHAYFSATTIRDKSGEVQGSFALTTDMTERKQAEAERNRLAKAIEQSAEVIIITDPEGNIQYVNPAFEKATGYTAKEVKGQNSRILKSGIQDETFYREMWQTITNGQTWQGRMINRRKDGSFYTEEASISPVLDGGGAIINFVAVKRDITSEINLEKRLAQAQKMEAIGNLAGGIAHDFNNILTPIMVHSEMVMNELPADSPLQMNMRQIYKGGERARDLVQQILTFARIREKDRIPLKASLIVKEAVKFLRSTIPSTIHIQYELKTEQDTVLADPTQMHQIMMNLCTNAVHVMREKGGRLEVTLMDEHIGPDEIHRFVGLSPGHYLRLSVKDTGFGIPPDIINRIFDPYFTTKGPGEGTGLGLAVIHGIVKSYGGDITAESEVGKGTTFHVLLPVIEAEVSLTIEPKVRLPRGRERILFIDDEKASVDAIRAMLERLGYNVMARTSSTEALETFRQHPDAFDLVITDQTMPHMTGKELAKEMMSIRPDIPIILCTGFSEQIGEKRAKEMGISGFIMKPIVMKQIAHTIREVLGTDGDET